MRAIAAGEITDLDMVREALAAEYEILAELGRGGMALVYRARDLQLERDVAIKVLPFALAFDADFVERFQREARTSAQLEHPNIIPIYRVGQAGRVIYFVMKYLRGGALSGVLAERKRLAPPEVRRVLIEAGSALGYAAHHGVVHRDIKPDNIMFDEFGQSMLTDFGIAKAASGQRLTGTGMSIGTPHYMSPEQARAQHTDGRSDIYSLGVVAYQCLAGYVPYDGEDSFSIGYKHITEPLPVPELNSADERRLFEVIRRMLAKEPADRYQSCEQLMAELQRDSVAPAGSLRVRQGDAPAPTLAAIPSPPPPAATTVVSGAAPPRRVAQRSPVLQQRERRSWPWAAAAAVLLAAGGGGYFYLSRSASAEPDPGPDSLAARTAAPGGADSVTPVSEGPRVDSIAGTAPAAVSAVSVEEEPAPAPAATPPVSKRDSGAIRLSGIPAGSTVQIDEANPIGAITRVAAGSHEVAVLAPQHEFYLDTVIVEAGDTVELVPALVRIGTPACSPGPAYNASQCFDQRPEPMEAPFVAAPGGNAPERGATFWVRVGADGQTLGVRIRQSSRNRRFDRVAMAFARRLTWEPARKGGTPVEAWTQIEVRPAS